MNIETGNFIHDYRGLKQHQPVDNDAVRLKQACVDFEAVFMDCMFQTMRKTLTGTDLVEKSLARDIYESMYFQQLSMDMAGQDKAMGIGAALYAELYGKMTGKQNNSVAGRAQYGVL